MDREIRVELDSAVGPRVVVIGEWDTAEVDAELPSGWQVDWATDAVRTDSGGWSHPLTAVE